MLSHWIYRKVQKPLVRIESAFTQVQEGDLSTKIELKGEKEFISIQNSFNNMVRALNVCTEEKESLEKNKKMMLLNLSHDIKTPLASIQGYAIALNEGYVSEEKKKPYYQAMVTKTDRIKELLDDMFELLKLENQDYIISMEQLDLCELIRETIAEYYDDIIQKGMLLDIDMPEIECYLPMNQILMKRAITNLLMNAVKHNTEGTRIKVGVVLQKNQVGIVIEDDGCGISDDMRQDVFQPFVKGDTSRSTAGGTGLGLAIVKTIIERHQGCIQCVETSVGSRFEISFQYII